MDPERLRYLFDADALAGLVDYDLDDESDRLEVVDRFLGLPADAAQRESRIAVRSIAVAQILADDPPEMWATVQRLDDAGLDRDAVLSQLSMVIGEHVSAALAVGTFDTAGYIEALGSLPLPTAREVAGRLIDTARSEPGIHVADHVDAVVASFAKGNEQAVESLINKVLERLIEGPLHWLPGDATVVVADVVAGRTLLHRLTDAEVELGVLSAGFDLGAFARFDNVRLTDGSVVEQFSVERGHLGWRGPDGWLAGFEPGRLLEVSVTLNDDDIDVDGGGGERFDATVAIAAPEHEPSVTDIMVDAVRSGYDELVAEPGLPVSGEELALWLLHHHPTLFDTPQPPLAVLCAAAGLEQRGGQVAHNTSIWRQELFHDRFVRVCDMVPEPEWRRTLGRALQVLDDPDADIDEIRDVLDVCAEPETLEVLADVLFDHALDPSEEFERDGVGSPVRLFDLVDRATTVARRARETATADYLACVLSERCGDPDTAEQHLKRAVDAQPRLGPAVERLGWYRFDRGDARGAMQWWRTLTDMPDAAGTIQPFLTRPAGDRKLGRNEPCWCGSGRKFKQCHQSRTDLPALPDRVAWLCRKASLWLDHSVGEVRSTVTDMAMARATGNPDLDIDLASFDDRELADLFTDAMADPIVFDTALHEGGLFAMFLHERGALLPDDEQLLAASWQTIERSVHEVIDIDAGEGMTLRDLATGDINDVRERTASRDAIVGERYCARVVPDGASNQMIGGIFPVRTGHETTVLDLCARGDGVELCAWVAALHQPPQVVRTPGLIEDLFDRDAIETILADGDSDDVMDRLGEELSRQAQARWLDEHIPALDGLTPREAAADPTRREQLERLLNELGTHHPNRNEPPPTKGGLVPINYDTTAMRHELGLE